MKTKKQDLQKYLAWQVVYPDDLATRLELHFTCECEASQENDECETYISILVLLDIGHPICGYCGNEMYFKDSIMKVTYIA